MIGAGLILSGVRSVSAATWYVSPVGNNAASGLSLQEAFQTLQYAVDRCGNGDTIYADQGTYNLGQATDYAVNCGVPARMALTKNVQIEALYGAGSTIIEGRKNSPTFWCGTNAMRGVFMANGTTLRGFTIRDGHTLDTAGDSNLNSGGGILAEGNSCYIYDCVIEGNSAVLFGGGCFQGEYHRSRISGNVNRQSGVGAGGGVASATLYSCEIASNEVEGASLFSNFGAHGGGAAYSTLYNCLVKGNWVNNGLGGGLYQCTAYNALVLDNRLTMLNPEDSSPYRGMGGGAYGGQLFNCTVAGNSASKSGGGTVEVTNAINCIVWSNTATWGDANHFYSTLAYSCSLPLPPGTGNISGNPQFADVSAGNYRLASSSPCRDAGLGMAWMDSWPWDYDKNLRVVGTTVDMGAFEYTASATWDEGYQDIGGGWRRLSWFGDYVPMGGEGWIWHNKHGFFFVPADSTPASIWFYAQDMGWLWTRSTTYPFLYRQSDAAWLWYNGARNPRWFRNMTTGTWESRP